ncbi:hypothetical protein B0H11DRAFT_2184268 [Mycena galericulata]|nr:hypothetical protein B0H11DRAFT_2184268 [Mycena galericulata]
MIMFPGDSKAAEEHDEVTTAQHDTHWQEPRYYQSTYLDSPTGGSPTGPGCSHRCTQCDSKKPVFVPQSTSRHDRRLVYGMDGKGVFQVIVGYYATATSVTLGMLLRRKETESGPSRQNLKTWLLVVLGFTWIVARCALYTLVDMFSYGLVITLFAAAYAMHRRSPVQDDEKIAPSAGHSKPVGA